jgi:hypothetical protein
MPWSATPMAYSPIRPKSQISNVGHDGTLSIRNFILMVKELKNPNFERFELHWLILAIIRPKSQISNVGHDGTLSIRNFLLMLKELKNPNFEAFGGQWSILVIIRHPAKVLNF